MTHLTLARIWTDLLPGTDLNDVLREIVGEHALSVAGKSIEVIRFRSFRIAVWIKAIFDIQRSHFSSSPPSQLLSSSNLLAAIYKVVEIRTEVFFLEDQVSDEYAKQRCFVVQAVLSGLRAMLLHGDNHNDEQSHILELHPLIHDWSAPGKSLEEFVINKCLDATRCIDTIPRLVGLGIESAFREKLAELRAGVDDAFWSLFDILWATEEAFIHSLADLRPTQPFAHGLDPRLVSEECLIEVVLGWCGGRNCNCIERLNSQQYLLASGQSQTGTFLQNHLKDFERFLRRRQQRLLGIASRVLPTEFDEIVASRLIDESGYGRGEVWPVRGTPSVSPSVSAYVLNCPRLHVVPRRELNSLGLTNGSAELLLGGAKNWQVFHGNPVSCPRCGIGFTSARRIDKLAELFEQAGTSQQPATLSLTRFESPDLPSSTRTLKPTASLSAASTASDLTVADTPQTSQRSIFDIFLPRSPRRTSSTNGVDRPKRPREKAKRQNLPPPPQSHRFSADGKTLLLWTKDGDHVSASVIPVDSTPPRDWRRYDIPGIQSAAGGGTSVAAISKNRQLLVFPKSGNLVPSERIVASGEIFGMTMSQGGEFVAVALEPEIKSKDKSVVLVYEIMDLEIRKKGGCDLKRSSTPGSQEFGFTSDNRLITARREITGKITIRLYDLDGRQTWDSVMEIGKSDGDNDRGLSSVLYNSVANVAIVTMYASVKYSVFHYDESQSVSAESRFQGATQSPSGNVVMFADSKNNLLPYDIGKKCYGRAIQLERKGFLAGQKDDLMALAMPNENTVHTFWVENGKMMLTTTFLNDNNDWEPIQRPIPEIEYRVDGLEENS